MLKIGKLYKVTDFALSDNAEFGPQNQAAVRDHGYLWIWDGKTSEANPVRRRDTDDTDDRAYHCRSLATGETRAFFPEELETSE